MSTQTLRIIVITAAVSLCIIPVIFLLLEGSWGEVITAVLAVAGFILTWEVTKPEKEENE